VSDYQFALIGHGAVGSLFARVLRKHGAKVISYDVLLDSAETAEFARRKILADGAAAGTFEQALGESECVLSVTPTKSCREVAARASRRLRPGQMYCDLASASPEMKREMAAVVNGAGAVFVEGVILGAVGASAVSPAILLGGAAAEAAAATLERYGLRARFYSREIGPASAFKMIRSVFSKGVETILIETLVAARRAGIFDDIWREIRATLAKDGVERMLETWIRSHAVSSERRYCEMREVGGFLEELGLEPVLTRAVTEVFRRSNGAGIAGRFTHEPEGFAEVIEFLESQP
jgi:3-hydroxyisobutyrate dehydrogenase-like beta-hydroxyacid dehydrogenase